MNIIKTMLKAFGEWFYDLALRFEAYNLAMGEMEEEMTEIGHMEDWADGTKLREYRQSCGI